VIEFGPMFELLFFVVEFLSNARIDLAYEEGGTGEEQGEGRRGF